MPAPKNDTDTNATHETLPHLPLAEFREGGYLYEINRRVLHPMGLAWAIDPDSETEDHAFTVTILDARDDPEGWRYGGDLYRPDLVAQFQAEWDSREDTRITAIGYMVQPVFEEGT